MAKSDHGKSATEGWSRAYEKAWLKIYGKICPVCNGCGLVLDISYEGRGTFYDCSYCNGLGYVENKTERKTDVEKNN